MDPDRETVAPGDEQHRQVRVSAWSLVRAIAVVLVALAAVAFLAAASRPLGWVIVAVIVAALLHPPVVWLSGRMPRGLAIPLVVLVALGAAGGLAFGVIGDVSDQVTRLERAAPQSAREIERSERFGELAQEVELARRVDEFVADVPERLRGGDEVTAIRSAATRGVTFVVTLVLMIFLLVSGPAMLESGLAQIADRGRRRRLERLVVAAHRRWWNYIVFTLARMACAGLFTYAIARAVDVPGPVLLSLWVALWAMVPTVGIVVGATAVALVAVPDSFGTAGAVLAFFAGYQVVEDALVQPRLEHRSLHVGAFLTFVASIFGLEVYGIGGLIGSVVVVVFAAALVKEIGLDEDEGIFDAAGDVVGDDEETYGDQSSGDEDEEVPT